MKKRCLIFICAFLFSIMAVVFGTQKIIVASAQAEQIDIAFFNNNVALTPTKIDDNTFTLEYIPDMIIEVKGIVSGSTGVFNNTILLNGKNVDYISKAGEYDITISFTQSGSTFSSYRKFTFIVTKKQVTNAKFNMQSLNIYYGEQLMPQLLMDDIVAQNSKVEYTYYTDSTKNEQVSTPTEVGNYWVVAQIVGNNYTGSFENQVTIAKSQCGISINQQNPTLTYSKAKMGDDGYLITDLLGATITNFDGSSVHTIQTYINDGDEYVLQDRILIPGTYEYKISFANNQNYYFEPQFGSIVVEKALTEIVFDSDIDIVYSLNMQTELLIKKLLNQDFFINNCSDNTRISEITAEMLNITFYLDDEVVESPTCVGDYLFRVSFDGNSYYLDAQSAQVALHIKQTDVSSEIQTYGEQTFEYGKDYNVESKFIIPSWITETPTYSYKRIINEGEVEDLQDQKPIAPGRYAIVLNITSQNYYASKTLIFNIAKLTIPLSYISIENLDYVYGDRIDVKVNVDSSYSISEDSISKTYKSLGGIEMENAPIYVGNYIVEVKIENDIYMTIATAELKISRKDLYVKVLDKTVVYGDPLFVLDSDNHYNANGFMFDGLVNENDKLSVVANLKVVVGDSKYTTNNMNIVVGKYSMAVEELAVKHPNYNIIDGGSGMLTVAPRELLVKVSSIKQYVGYTFSPSINIENCVYNDKPENMAMLFEIYYSTEQKEELTIVPSFAGVYNINARVIPSNIDCDDLKNYTVKYQAGTLTLLNNQQSFNDLIVIEGKFEQNANLQVSTINANDSIKKAVSQVAPKNDIEKLFFIRYTIETVDNTQFLLKLNCAGMDLTDAKVLIAYSPDDFQEVQYTVMGDYIVLRLSTMASYYAVCTTHKLPVMWIIIICAIVGVILIGVGIFLWIYFSGANVKARKNDVELSTAVTASGDYKSEDDELDELIENFDESTVQKQEDPAERIARQQEKELREQYRLRLRRMRNSGDKSLNDKMQEMGLSDNDFDEEKAIDALIAEDRKKKAMQEEQERREREEQEKQKAKETGFVINERKSGTLTNKISPIVPKFNDDDIIDDDDIDL